MSVSINVVDSHMSNVTIYGYTRSRWLDRWYPKWLERLLEWWRGL